MLCEKCQKNQASVHMAQIINGQKVENHYCEECARKEGLGNAISFQDIFQSFFNLANDQPVLPREETEQNKVLRCPSCRASYDDVKRTGKLGCPTCYVTFQPQIDIMLKSIHGGNLHKGKMPLKNGEAFRARRECQQLKKKLAEAIQIEEYEEAARLRDEIRALEKEG